jgi:hypothetical protein
MHCGRRFLHVISPGIFAEPNQTSRMIAPGAGCDAALSYGGVQVGRFRPYCRRRWSARCR